MEPLGIGFNKGSFKGCYIRVPLKGSIRASLKGAIRVPLKGSIRVSLKGAI